VSDAEVAERSGDWQVGDRRCVASSAGGQRSRTADLGA
jgi:hypothetical protein